MDYNELEDIVREALCSHPTKCCGYVCGKRLNKKDIDDELVESLCVRLLCIQQVNMHRVPQIMAMFQDMVDKESGTAGKSMNDNSYISGSSDGVRSRNIEMQFMGGETKTSPSTRFERGNIGNDELEVKNPEGVEVRSGGPGGTGGARKDGRSDAQTEMEWNVDIMSGDAFHSALYVYKKHFEEGHLNFVETLKEQDSALRYDTPTPFPKSIILIKP